MSRVSIVRPKEKRTGTRAHGSGRGCLEVDRDAVEFGRWLLKMACACLASEQRRQTFVAGVVLAGRTVEDKTRRTTRTRCDAATAAVGVWAGPLE